MNNIITPFIFSDLPAPVAAELQAVTSRIKDRLIRQVTDIIETGRDLIEVKSKLDHGQFQSWLNLSFNMTVRTAQKYMQAAEWMTYKSELSSHLTPNTIYLLSAPTTPEAAQRQVLGGLEAGKVVNHREVCETVREVKHQEREAKKKQRLTRAERERRKAYLERLRCQEEDERQRILTAAMAVAREVAVVLVNKLSEDEIKKVDDALIDPNVTYMILREAIMDARHSLGDNVTVFPPKPWESKS